MEELPTEKGDKSSQCKRRSGKIPKDKERVAGNEDKQQLLYKFQ